MPRRTRMVSHRICVFSKMTNAAKTERARKSQLAALKASIAYRSGEGSDESPKPKKVAEEHVEDEYSFQLKSRADRTIVVMKSRDRMGFTDEERLRHEAWRGEQQAPYKNVRRGRARLRSS